MTVKLESLLKYLVERKEGLDKPVTYQEDDWYIRCEAKSDMLAEIIDEVKSLLKET
jgi:hypothetical protein